MSVKFISAFNPEGFAHFGIKKTKFEDLQSKHAGNPRIKVINVKRKLVPMPPVKACNKKIVRHCSCKQ